MKLIELFNIHNGLASSNVSINEIKTTENEIAYIRPSSSWNNLVAGYVLKEKINSKYIFPTETLFVSTDGDGSHSYAYVSAFDFVPNSNVSVLIPKNKMTLQEKIYYATCITANRYKFSYGRKPKGKRLGDIVLPTKIPTFVKKSAIKEFDLDITFDEKNSFSNKNLSQIQDLFNVSYGNSLELNSLQKADDEFAINFVSRTSQNNGVSAKVSLLKNLKPFDKGLITVTVGGSVLEAFVQSENFYTGYHVMILHPKKTMTLVEKLYYCFCIRQNKYRYNYGRQANRTLRTLNIPSKLPNWIIQEKINNLLEISK